MVLYFTGLYNLRLRYTHPPKYMLLNLDQVRGRLV